MGRKKLSRTDSTYDEQSRMIGRSKDYFSVLRRSNNKIFRMLNILGRGHLDKAYMDHVSKMNAIRFEIVYKVDHMTKRVAKRMLIQNGFTVNQAERFLSVGIYREYKSLREDSMRLNYLAKKILLDSKYGKN